jgi:hypothetical protein
MIADFHFIGTFRYPSVSLCQSALEAFSVEPAPIPPHAVHVDHATLRIDYRTTSVPCEWSAHLRRAALLAINATDGAMVCTYSGPSATGHRVQRVRLTPGGGRVEQLPKPTVIPRINA